MTGFGWIHEVLANPPPGLTGAVDAAEREAQSIVFADGSRPGGIDPARIYGWFHDGPGTRSYVAAANDLRGLADRFADYAVHVQAAQRALADGWHGAAGESAVRSLGPVLTASHTVTIHAQCADRVLTEQISSFVDTRTRVVLVPRNPPHGPGSDQLVHPLAPNNLAADAQVAAYQVGTHANQDAYGSYRGQTSPQSAQLPQDSGDPSGPSHGHPPRDPVHWPSRHDPASPAPSPPGSGLMPPGHPGSGSPQQGSGEQPGGRPHRGNVLSAPAPQPHSTVQDHRRGDLSGPSDRNPAASAMGWEPVAAAAASADAAAGGSASAGASVDASVGPGGAGGSATAGPSTGEGAGGRSGGVGGGGKSQQGGGMPNFGNVKREDDKEHSSSGLLTQERDNELIGDLPAVAPAVIEAGDDYDDYD